MKSYRWVTVGLVFLLTGTLLGRWLYLQAPQWVAEYAEEKVPWIKVGRVELGYPEMVFHDVKVKKDWVTGTLKQVIVDSDRNVTVDGGHLDIDLDKRPKSVADAKPKEVNLQSVKIDTFKVVRGPKQKRTEVEGDELTFDGTQYCFKEASLRTTDERLKAFLYIPSIGLSNGCFKDATQVTLQQALIAIDVPKSVPTLGGHYLVTLKDVEVYPVEEYFKAKLITVGGYPSGEAHMVSVAYKHDTLYVDASFLEVDHSWIAPKERFFTDVRLALDVPTKKGTVSSKAAVISFDLERRQVKGEQDCNEWLDALPQPPSPAIKALQGAYKGRLSFEVSTEPTPHLSIKNQCKVDCSREVIKELKSRFEYKVYDRAGELTNRESGPATREWIPLHRFPVNIPSAFIKLEDPAFMNHRGILPASLNVALEQNLEKGRFYRGGSTITQQLAKNLWLRRHKTIGRKVEEAFLTIALESCLSKEQILELYFNVIEYGPDLYGIGPATRTYFNKPVEALTLKEAYFLAALLRNPKAALKPDQGGLARAQQLMALLAKNGMLDETLVPATDNIDTSGWETE